MSRVTVNPGAIDRFFAARPLAGAGFPGLRTGSAELLAARMARVARRNASGQVVRARTGDLANSVRGIVRPHPRGGTEIGVGTTLEYGAYLENGTEGQYIIAPRRIDRLLVSAPGHPDPLRGPRRFVIHPGIQAEGWLRQAVNDVARGGV